MLLQNVSILLIVVAALATTSKSQSTAPTPAPTGVLAVKWTEWSNAGCACKLLAPGSVVNLSEPSKLVPNETQYEHVIKTDYALFKLGYTTVPVSLPFDDKEKMKMFFERYVAGLAKDGSMTILEQAEFEVGGAFGRQATFADGEVVHMNRYTYRNQKFYALTTTTYKENHAEPAMRTMRRKFLDSFAFTK